MKTRIVYYSLGGNTDWAAEQIADRIGGELLRLQPVRDYPKSGFRKFFRGGKSAVMAETPDLSPYAFDPSACDRVVLGFPVWAGTLTPPLRTFLRDNDLSGLRVAVFACQSGAGAEKAFGKLKDALGIDAFEAELILIDPKDKPDPANDEKLRDFCAKLAD